MTSISTAILQGGRPDLSYQLMGDNPVDSTIIKTYDDYQLIYHKRHDLIHAAVCDKLLIPFGEKTVDSILKSKNINLDTADYYNEIKKQTPDFLGVYDKTVKIVEITISYDLRAKNRKYAKYALLCRVLNKAGFDIDYKIYVFNPKNIYLNRPELIMNGLDDVVLDFAKKICDNASLLLREVHRTKDGQRYFLTFHDNLEHDVRLDFSYDDVVKTHNEFASKCFHNLEDLKDVLHETTSPVLDQNDDDFIQEVLNETKKCKSEMFTQEDFDEKDFLDDMESKATTKDYRSSLPMCFIGPKTISSSVRNTSDDWSKVSLLCAKMIDGSNSTMATIGIYCAKNLNSIKNKEIIKNEDFLFSCKLSEIEKKEIALDGPGRKKYVRQKSSDHKIAEEIHNGYALSPMVDVSSIENLSFLFSQKDKIPETGDMFKDMSAIVKGKGVGLDYVKLCQTIYREININSMRGDRRHKFIIKPTGAEGVYICLYPGTKLRCGELSNIVWYKIIIDNDYEDNSFAFSSHWIFKKFYRDNKVSYSRWLSCDVHRLDHYIRSYDKILMSYLAILSQKFKSVVDIHNVDRSADDPEVEQISLLKSYNMDSTNTLGLIILIYLEDKRSTSKMMQNVRYLVMNSISISPKYKSVMSKFNEAIRSPLQLYLLKKCLEYINRMRTWKISMNVRFGSVKYDYKNHMFLDIFGGSNVKLPRPIITDPNGCAEFSEILSEMYFTMLFNKNQDDPTHASFQILDKIIEGEDNFQEVKNLGLHLGYYPKEKFSSQNDADIAFVRKILEKKKSHMFSRRSMEISSKLLRLYLDDDFADQIIMAASNSNLDKTLDEFATFKSSSTLKNFTFNAMESKQNKRRRCIEGVNDLLKEGLKSSFEVAINYKNEDTYYHVFKKNQIGGVREILILPITNRIRINILETLSRNICKYDRREVLTHGVTKNESIRSLLYSAKKLEGTRAPIHLTFDKSKWGPSFVPIQFLYLFTPFKKQLKGLFPFIVDLLIRHQNKHCVMPDRLLTAWNNDEDDKKHKFVGLQRLKEKFKQTKNITYKNESNMGQGILHYTSSLLHLCMITFRDELYRRWCDDLKLDSKDHEDLLSSDDSYTIFCPELSKEKTTDFVKMKLQMFLQCQQISEYLFNCRTSKVKSSINPLIGEFNSLFITNMTFIPTLIKFCLSSVHPVNTDSFYRMVKESFGSTRQIVENGGGLDLYLCASILNKNYCEEIYHTSNGGVNDLSTMGINYKPYHIGEYPIFNPSLMVIFGPEYHNYKLYKREWSNMNIKEKRLFMSSHKILKGGLIETMAEFEDGDTILGGLMRIEASVGPVKQLERIRRDALLSKEELELRLTDDPLMIIKKPKTIEEIKFRVTHKLYTTGSKEALKNLAASIFYGRVSATVSANAFYIPNGDSEKKTYRECLHHLIESESEYENLDSHINFLYPRHNDYDMFINNDKISMKFHPRNPYEIQTVQHLTTHRIYTKLTQSVPDILDFKWQQKEIPEHLLTKVERDFRLMKEHFPLIRDTIEETKDQFSGEERDKSKAILLLILKLYSLKDRSFKGVIYGMGSHDISKTYETLIERNFSNSVCAELTQEVNYIRLEETFDKIYCAHNQTILLEFSESKVRYDLWDSITERELILFFQDPSINKNLKKRVFMCSVTNGFIKNSEDWSGKVGILLHYWHKKQRNIDGKYIGDFDLTVYQGHHKLNVYYNSESDKYFYQKIGLESPEMLFEFIKEVSSITDKNINELTTKTLQGSWMVQDDRVIKTMGQGFKIDEMEETYSINLDECKLLVSDDWTRLVDSAGFNIFNIETGLISTDYRPDIKYDFRVFGLSFIKMCNLGCFNQNFNVLYKSRKDCLEVLDDIEINRPKVTAITMRRLGLHDGWSERKIEALSDDITLEDKTDIITDLMDVGDFNINDLTLLLNDDEDKAIHEMVDFLLKTDVIFSMKTIQRIQHTRKVFQICKNVKSDLVCRLTLFDMKINKQVIRSISQIMRNGNRGNILNSLISFYDRIYHTEGQQSPKGIAMDIDEDFLIKFGIKSILSEECDLNDSD